MAASAVPSSSNRFSFQNIPLFQPPSSPLLPSFMEETASLNSDWESVCGDTNNVMVCWAELAWWMVQKYGIISILLVLLVSVSLQESTEFKSHFKLSIKLDKLQVPEGMVQYSEISVQPLHLPDPTFENELQNSESVMLFVLFRLAHNIFSCPTRQYKVTLNSRDPFFSTLPFPDLQRQRATHRDNSFQLSDPFSRTLQSALSQWVVLLVFWSDRSGKKHDRGRRHSFFLSSSEHPFGNELGEVHSIFVVPGQQNALCSSFHV